MVANKVRLSYYIDPISHRLLCTVDTMDVEDFISKYWKFKKSIAVLKSHSEIEAEDSKKFRAAFKKSKQEELTGVRYGMVFLSVVGCHYPNGIVLS